MPQIPQVAIKSGEFLCDIGLGIAARLDLRQFLTIFRLSQCQYRMFADRASATSVNWATRH